MSTEAPKFFTTPEDKEAGRVEDIAKAQEMAEAGKPSRDALAEVRAYPEDRHKYLFEGTMPPSYWFLGSGPLYLKRIMPDELKNMASHYEHQADSQESLAATKYEIDVLVKGMDDKELGMVADKAREEMLAAKQEYETAQQKLHEGKWSSPLSDHEKETRNKYFDLLYRSACFDRIVEKRKNTLK